MSYERGKIAQVLYEGNATDSTRRQQVNEQFGEWSLIAEVIRRLYLQPCQTVVDVGCGGGAHLLELAKVVGPTGRAQGYDFSAAAVEVVRKRGCQAEVADAARLPLPDASVYALSCNYAIYYFDDLAATLREWHRVLRPGARVVITGPDEGNNAELYSFHERIFGLPPSDADVMALGHVGQVVVPQLAQEGFTQVELHRFANPVTYPHRQAFVDYWTATSLFARTVPTDQRPAVIARALAELAAYAPFVVTKRVALVTCVRI